MTLTRSLPVLLIAGLSVISACKKDTDRIAQPEPVTPDLTVKITSSVAGFVTDETNEPVPFAEVVAGDKQTRTDEYGYFKISNVALPKSAGYVKVSAGGSFDSYKTFVPAENKEAFVRIKLLAKKEIGVVEASSGGPVNTTEGATITLPANGIVIAGTGVSYTGKVHVNARWINPAEESSIQSQIPGDNRGTDTEGHLKTLRSYGAVAVELTADNGQLLQIAGGKTATLNIPVSASLAAQAPATLNLWSFNDSTGLWKQEGTATKTGNAYVGTVSHFSFWDGAEGFNMVNVKARITDASAHPLVNVPVSITFAGMPQNAGYSKFGYTDADGYVSGAVFANSNLVLDVLTTCATSAYSHAFTTAATDIDLGTITGNLGQNTVTISGTVTNCNNQPVTNGYIQTYDHGFYNRISISNGSFSFTGLACTNTAVSVVAVDNATNQQNAPQTITLVPGVNNLGTLSACGTSTVGVITYTLDGVTTTLTEPVDTLGAYYITAGPISATQVLTLSGNPNQSQQMAFQFDGGADTESAHHVTEVYSVAFPGGRGYWPVPVVVNITEYGKIGGFIGGNFSSYLLDIANNGVHTFNCTFRVRRNN
ncbi:MAG: carboxypeptidase-like regulatory domain-containing protein [Chitinophagaceae bacterium]